MCLKKKNTQRKAGTFFEVLTPFIKVKINSLYCYDKKWKSYYNLSKDKTDDYVNIQQAVLDFSKERWNNILMNRFGVLCFTALKKNIFNTTEVFLNLDYKRREGRSWQEKNKVKINK